jgi:hypothetical protein
MTPGGATGIAPPDFPSQPNQEAIMSNPILSKGKNKFCFYCGCTLVAGNKQDDHFPTPDRHGGTATVASCNSCHDMKDRIDVGDWNPEWFGIVMDDLQNAKKETRVFLAKAIAIMLDAKKIVKDQLAMAEIHTCENHLVDMKLSLQDGYGFCPECGPVPVEIIKVCTVCNARASGKALDRLFQGFLNTTFDRKKENRDQTPGE